MNGPFITHYDEKGAPKIMCTGCYSEMNEQKKAQCSLCKSITNVREYIDLESDGLYKHKLCTNCFNKMKTTTDIQLAAAPVDPDTIKFNELSIHGIDDFRSLRDALG